MNTQRPGSYLQATKYLCLENNNCDGTTPASLSLLTLGLFFFLQRLLRWASANENFLSLKHPIIATDSQWTCSTHML